VPTTTLNVRGIDAEAAERIKRSAQTRGLTVGAYLARLIELHHTTCMWADQGDETCGKVLEELGLETVRT
jgi:hypothetical protein